MSYSVKFIFSVLSLLVLSCNKDDRSIPCIPPGLSSDVIAFYPFSNGSLNDFSGTGAHLTNTTTAGSTSDRAGNPNCAYEFDNLPPSSEFLTTSNIGFLNGLNKFSISLWYQPLDTSQHGSEYEVLVGRGNTAQCPNRSGEWSVGLYDCRKAVFGRTNSVWDNNIMGTDCYQEVIARTDTWHHLVVTYKQSGIEMAIYRDGFLQENSFGHADCGSGVPTVQDLGDLFIGSDYTGKLDDIIFFDKVLSQSEITSLFELDVCCEE